MTTETDKTERGPVRRWVQAAANALSSYEIDYGERLPDDHELGRIDDSRGSPSFRIRAGHIRQLCALLGNTHEQARATLDTGGRDLDRDIGILIPQIDRLTEFSSEKLDAEDAALVDQIRADHEARAAQPHASADAALADMLREVVIAAIREIGPDAFRQTSMFSSAQVKAEEEQAPTSAGKAGLEEVGTTQRGYTIFREPNGVGGHRYWSDEIGGGVMVWDTCLGAPETLLECLRIEGVASAGKVEPVAWPNGCDKTAVAALRYLSTHERPEGGEQLYNFAHLGQIADELEAFSKRPLYAAPSSADARQAAEEMRDRVMDLVWRSSPGTAMDTARLLNNIRALPLPGDKKGGW